MDDKVFIKCDTCGWTTWVGVHNADQIKRMNIVCPKQPTNGLIICSGYMFVVNVMQKQLNMFKDKQNDI